MILRIQALFLPTQGAGVFGTLSRRSAANTLTVGLARQSARPTQASPRAIESGNTAARWPTPEGQRAHRADNSVTEGISAGKTIIEFAKRRIIPGNCGRCFVCGGVMSAKSGRRASPKRSHLDVLRGGSAEEADLARRPTSDEFTQPMSLLQRVEAGKALRDRVPRAQHGKWTQSESRADPIDILLAADAERIPEARSHSLWAHAAVALCVLPGIGGDYGGRSQCHAKHRNNCAGVRRLPLDEFRGVCHARTQHPFRH